jgi:solute carrier family 29 (equilibrative nucleoside transporter), member 1/2/3
MVSSSNDSGLARWLFMLIGVGYLFPFSALTQPVDYWELLFPDFDIEFSLTAVFMWVNLIVLAFFVFWGDTEPNYSRRIYAGFAGQFIALFIVPTSYFWHLSESKNELIVLGSTAFAAAVTALIDSCVISLASLYPVACQEGLQVGIGLSTLIGSVYRIFTKASFPETMVVQSSLLYFYTGAATILVCIYAYYLLRKIPPSSVNDYELLDLNISNSGKGSSAEEDGTKLVDNKKENYQSVGSEEGNFDSIRNATEPPLRSSRWEVFSSVMHNEAMVFLVFTSTLALWPPLVAEIKSHQFPNLNETEWWPLILLFDFALLDVIGRFCISYRGWFTASNIWIPVLARVLILSPIIVLLAKGLVFTHDFYSIFFVGLLGFTNGYLGSLAIIFVNEVVPSKDKGLAGILTGFTLNAGLVAGATLAIWVQEVV